MSLVQPVAVPPDDRPDHPPPPAAPSDRRLVRFVGVVVAAGVGILLASLPALASPLFARALPFLLLAVIIERLTDLELGKVKMSLGAVAVMGAAALGGPAAGALAGLISALAAWYFAPTSLMKGAFNAGMVTLGGAAAGVPVALVGGSPALDLPSALLGTAIGLIYFVVNYGLLAMVIALATGSDWLTEWRLHCNWLILHYAVMGVVGLGLVVLYTAYGLPGLLLLLAPVGVLYYAQRQYVGHTAAYVEELSSSNERLQAALSELRSGNDAMLVAFSEALELRDRETEGHSQRVVRYSRSLAFALGMPAAQSKVVEHGALLHDIGKIGVPDAILLKPGKLTDDEWVVMKRHPEIGYRMIAHIPFLGPASLLVRHHHERWDGRGYPDGLAGEAIPLGARIFAVADTFDAMTNDRPYRAALSWEEALAELERCAGSQFDPAVVAAMRRLVMSGALGQLNPPTRQRGAA